MKHKDGVVVFWGKGFMVYEYMGVWFYYEDDGRYN